MGETNLTPGGPGTGPGGGTEHGVPPLEHVPTLVRFLHHDMVSSGLLLCATFAALVVVNVGYEARYHEFWDKSFGFTIGDDSFYQSLHHWVNDGLMALFFFFVGLEIKRELLAGELASWRRAVLPAAAALGGVIVPALIYTAFNIRGEGVNGWGIAMATDIAFAAGCLALLRKWIPPALMVFLVALAIVDDLFAVAVIAVFYTERIAFVPLEIGAGLIVLSFVLGQFGVRSTVPYVLIGILLWLAFLESGVHATIAGVLLAFSIPEKARYETHNFRGRMLQLIDRFTHAEKLWPDETKKIKDVMVNERQQSILRHMGTEIHHVEAPLQRIERNLEPFALFIIMPIFAFANAGVHLDWAEIGGMIHEPVTLGIVFGLVIGKPLGIVLAAWLAVRAGLATLPKGVSWPQLTGVGMLAGIGFTMSLFINELAFLGGDPAHAEALIAQGKIGIFIASGLASVGGLALLKFTCREVQETSMGKH